MQIRVSYRNCPKVTIHIGNKCSNELEKFILKELGKEVLNGETIAGRSYIKHEVEITPENYELLFINYELSYSLVPEASPKIVMFFVQLAIRTSDVLSP